MKTKLFTDSKAGQFIASFCIVVVCQVIFESLKALMCSIESSLSLRGLPYLELYL